MKLRFYFSALLLVIALQACKTGGKVAATDPVATDNKTGVNDEKQVNVQYNYYNGVKEKLLGNYDKAAELFSQVGEYPY